LRCVNLEELKEIEDAVEQDEVVKVSSYWKLFVYYVSSIKKYNFNK
jgi:hypothetical protein